MYGSRPLSKLESAVYVIVVSALVLVLFERLLAQFAYAERAAVEATLLRTQSALHTRLAYDLLRGKAPDLAAWSARNPFELAHVELEDFAGVRDAPADGTLQAGKWVFDRATRELIYMPRHARGLSIEGGGTALRFRLTLEGASGLPRLVPAVPYRWEP